MNEPENKTVKRSRNIALTFRVDDKEHELIKKRMEQAGIKNMRAFILKMSLEGRIIHVELDSVKDMTRLLSNATSNINQIARRVNATGNVYAEDIDELRNKYDGLWKQTKEILRRLSDI